MCPETFECVEELLKIKNLIAIRGNHDDCWYQSIRTGNQNLLFNKGGKETLESYIKNCYVEREYVMKMSGYSTDYEFTDMPISHYTFWKNQLPYYIDKDNNLFVHGGFNRHHLIEETEKYGNISDLWWDRDLLHAARSYSSMKNNEYPFKNKNNFKEIFVGHTPVQYFNESTPQKYANVWDLDTGCGKGYHLTIMDLETKEYWSSTYGNHLNQ